MRKLVLLFVMASFMALMPLHSALAGNGPVLFGNGNFETGDLFAWDPRGDAGVADFNVLNGVYSAFITTGGAAIGGMCSELTSLPAFPASIPRAVNVSFKVRYKTDEGVGAGEFYIDPFHAHLQTGAGMVTLVSINASGLTPGPATTVRRLDTGTLLPPPPTVPPFFPGLTYANETPTLEVRSRVPYSKCDPVRARFFICNSGDQEVDSAAFLDDVAIAFENGGGGIGPAAGSPVACPPPVFNAESEKAR